MIRVLNAAPTEADVQKYYDNNPKASELPEKVHVRHVAADDDPATRAPLADDQVKAKKKRIDDILKQARGGADFAALAKQYSEDPGTKDSGGELPPFAKASADPSHAMVPEFEAAAFSLTNNQISEVITTQYGYHIIELMDKTPARKTGADRQAAGERHDARRANQEFPDQPKTPGTGAGVYRKTEQVSQRGNSGSRPEHVDVGANQSTGSARRIKPVSGATGSPRKTDYLTAIANIRQG